MTDFIHIFQPPAAPRGPILLFLHGTGGSERDLVPLADILLPAAAILETLANAPVPPNPLDAAPDAPSRTLLALALQHHEDAVESSSREQSQTMVEQVENALHALESRRLERRQREIRSLIAEADRRGDQAILSQLTAENLQIDRALRQR